MSKKGQSEGEAEGGVGTVRQGEYLKEMGLSSREREWAGEKAGVRELRRRRQEKEEGSHEGSTPTASP